MESLCQFVNIVPPGNLRRSSVFAAVQQHEIGAAAGSEKSGSLISPTKIDRRWESAMGKVSFPYKNATPPSTGTVAG